MYIYYLDKTAKISTTPIEYLLENHVHRSRSASQIFLFFVFGQSEKTTGHLGLLSPAVRAVLLVVVVVVAVVLAVVLRVILTVPVQQNNRQAGDALVQDALQTTPHRHHIGLLHYSHSFSG